MIELSGYGWVLSAIGWAYWLLAFVALIAAWKLPKTKAVQMLAALIVVVVFGYMPVNRMFQIEKVRDVQQIAKAHFEMRCKGAGEKIYKTVENVDGILLMKLRPVSTTRDWENQYWMGDPYGDEIGGDGYIQTFLEERYAINEKTGTRNKDIPPEFGYKFVDVVHPDEQRYRYTGCVKESGKKDSGCVNKERLNDPNFSDAITQFALLRRRTSEPIPRYGVTWEDISTPEDRKVWVAGGSLKVIDLQTNEVLAERIGYVVDFGQGSTNGGRSPWKIAQNFACPEFPQIGLHDPRKSNGGVGRTFIFKVLKQRKGN